jgi:hypothetical protein
VLHVAFFLELPRRRAQGMRPRFFRAVDDGHRVLSWSRKPNAPLDW